MSRIGNYTNYMKQVKKTSLKQRINAFLAIVRLLFLADAWKTLWELIFIWYIKKYRPHYTHIEYLPLFHFAEIAKGKLKYLYHKPKNRKVPRVYFANILENMHYQFTILDNEHLRKKADLADYKSRYVRAKSKVEKSKWLNKYNTLNKELQDVVEKKTFFNLDEFTDYIEQALNITPGSIDVHKISTAKAFMNYQQSWLTQQGVLARVS